ncbi:hypothetical protein GXW78_19225 [Roseomonas terrae]|jgi:hypothetical protein|uniref:Uncharacterized protein n=1 Tax=Neoroseomonas terrae TaxID=424799 RepID=A0ABS5EL99_9PROT|nr:hypothetical protein [Neoroseomonas terrae]MBR0651810.1 hypothetical protein [Neoroseomonas terrae]
MILATLFLLGALVLLVLAWRALRRLNGAAAADGPGMRIVLKARPGKETPELTLESNGTVMFGPVTASWAPDPTLARALDNAEGAPGRAGGAVAAGSWRVAALVDLAAADALGSGQPALDARLRRSLGDSALLLERVDGGAPPVLLHGRSREAIGSLGGIGMQRERFVDLLARLGEPRGLAVEVLRRRIQRAGWGGERAQRRRAG